MNIQNKKIDNRRGFSTIELLIAFAILLVNITGILLLSSGVQGQGQGTAALLYQGQSVSVNSETNQEAIHMAQGLLEKARADSREDFNLVNPYTGSNPSGPLTYTETLNVTQPDFFTKEVVSTVTWEIAGKNFSSILTTLLTNPEAINGGDTCGSVLEGDWTNLQKTEYEFGDDILNDTSSGFPITAIQTFDKKMYITVNNVNGNNDETFFILNITDSVLTNGDVLGKLDNSPGAISEGLSSVAVDGTSYAYVANAYDSSPKTCIENHNCAQLQIIDIGNPSNPSVIRNFKVDSSTSGNKLANGTSVFYRNKIVYLGLANATSGPELYILDVGGGGMGGTPSSPIVLSSIEIGNGINAISVKDNYLYMASPHSQELKIFNVSDLSSPASAGNFNSLSGSGNGKSMYLVGSKLYLGKTVPNTGNDFHILNKTNSDIALPELGGKNFTSSINGIIVRNYLAFFITSNGQFQTWKIDDPTNITEYASPLTLPPGSGGGLQGTATDCEGNYIFVGSESSNDKGYISVITGGP